MTQISINNIQRDSNKVLKIGIMGGTFDPIHYGHLAIAEAVRIELELDQVIFIPVGNPPHKLDQNVTDKNDRYAMTILATVTNPYFDVSRLEIDREGYTYTIDTIKSLREILGQDTQFYFIIGADTVHQILTWKQPEHLFKMCEFVAVTRPGYQSKTLFNEIDYLRVNYDCSIHFTEVPSLEISSTDIREKVQKKMSIKYLLPESVESYIHKHRLYR